MTNDKCWKTGIGVSLMVQELDLQDIWKGRSRGHWRQRKEAQVPSWTIEISRLFIWIISTLLLCTRSRVALRGRRVNEGHSPCTQGIDVPFECLRCANIREGRGKPHTQIPWCITHRCGIECYKNVREMWADTFSKSSWVKRFWTREAFKQTTQKPPTTHRWEWTRCVGGRKEISVPRIGHAGELWGGWGRAWWDAP